jgi:enamine deaminase RidA (YjgF/YER057c/UK114 family)
MVLVATIGTELQAALLLPATVYSVRAWLDDIVDQATVRIETLEAYQERFDGVKE